MDLLTIIADQQFRISYHPKWNEITGSVEATLLLQQCIYRWRGNGGRPFYKFMAECSHQLYRHGDSWTEELGISDRVFRRARKQIGEQGDKAGHVPAGKLIGYYTDRASNLTWYTVDEAAVIAALSPIYEGPPVDNSVDNPPDHMTKRKPPHDKTSGGTLQNVSRHMTKRQVVKGGPPDESAFPINNNNKDNSKEKDTQKQPSTAAAVFSWLGFMAGKQPQDLSLDIPTLLAWTWAAKLETTAANPVGLVVAQWRRGHQPPEHLHKMAHWWLTADYTDQADLIAAVSNSYRDLPHGINGAMISAARKIIAATGQLVPDELKRPDPPPAPAPPEPSMAGDTTIDDDAHRPTPPDAAMTADDEHEQTWQAIQSDLEMQMSKSQYATFIRPAQLYTTDDGRVLISHPQSRLNEWIEQRLLPTIQRTAGYHDFCIDGIHIPLEAVPA